MLGSYGVGGGAEEGGYAKFSKVRGAFSLLLL